MMTKLMRMSEEGGEDDSLFRVVQAPPFYIVLMSVFNSVTWD